MDTKSLEQLGKNLVEEYGLESSTSTLERWMLHYLAELFDKEREYGNADETKTIQLEIKEIILEFWRLRYRLADEDSLFKKNQALIDTLEKISPQSVIPISSFFNPYDSKDTLEVSEAGWQERLLAIDKSSKVVMSHCVLKYLNDIADKNNDIVKLIESIEAFNSPESFLSRFYGDETAETDKIENIEERIQNLTVFIDTAESVLEEYRSELASLAVDSHNKPK
ncbi:hypothetical protein DVY93_00635 [Psychrobacter sp. CCUG 69069]|jgi:hypothetical protein|uniref:hypothetical protein n=1 Tax=unclassified Psychrobacter TaxID=196806 RepID=UPI000C7AD0D9|nr:MULTISPECIES: hypothetical protein [unclassified Psychrobacter]MCD1278273.1 hypothetical protein [Psychrobacter sp. CCUG 69069]PKG67686.1 hypothetical protein CXF56_01840 [Psychrobacter sp. Choline-02u-13]PKH55024.1 hypothetical protein CXF69_00705 [Psychrobacter sp. Choline-02u-9]PKH64848.1 hypothetical protein CXF61_09460 [Psychrobacter sp. 4Dc]